MPVYSCRPRLKVCKVFGSAQRGTIRKSFLPTLGRILECQIRERPPTQWLKKVLVFGSAFVERISFQELNFDQQVFAYPVGAVAQKLVAKVFRTKFGPTRSRILELPVAYQVAESLSMCSSTEEIALCSANQHWIFSSNVGFVNVFRKRFDPHEVRLWRKFSKSLTRTVRLKTVSQ